MILEPFCNPTLPSIGVNFNMHLVADKYSNPIHPHFPRKIGQNFAIRPLELYLKKCVWESFRNRTKS